MKLLSVSEVSRMLSCTTMQVYRLLREGYLEELMHGRRHYVTVQSVEEFIRTHKHNGHIDTSLTFARLLKEHPELLE